MTGPKITHFGPKGMAAALNMTEEGFLADWCRDGIPVPYTVWCGEPRWNIEALTVLVKAIMPLDLDSIARATFAVEALNRACVGEGWDDASQ